LPPCPAREGGWHLPQERALPNVERQVDLIGMPRLMSAKKSEANHIGGYVRGWRRRLVA
jgi:hypothetical protein